MRVLSVIMVFIAAFTLQPTYAHGSGGHSSGGNSAGRHGSSNPTHFRGTGTGSSQSRTHISGYTKKNGTHVNSYYRSRSDGTKANNWSTKGNINPVTGKRRTH